MSMQMKKPENIPAARRDELVVQDLENEILIYDLRESKAYCLNETSALIWYFCDGKNSVEEIKNLFSRRTKNSVTDEFIWLALSDLESKNLLQPNFKASSDFDNLSRRELIRRAGVASLIALPLVSALVVPQAIDAASACVIGTSCTCSVANNINLTTGVNCRTLGGTPTGCGTALTCDCLVTSSTTNGSCVGV